MTSSYKRYAYTVLAVLGIQALLPWITQASLSPASKVLLSELPRDISGWRLTEDVRLDEDVLSALAPDDYLARLYQREGDHARAELLVAYFRSQEEGFGPHSPQVCLPASGWDPVQHEVVDVPDANGGTFRANHFVIKNGARSSEVLYWYHTSERVSTGEIEARLWLAWDSLMLRGTDVALVRVIVPIVGNDANRAAEAASNLSTLVHRDLNRVWKR